jgi:CRP/FNR family putative post-exponential-phase nitrogen-starvation transcriptional regulator
MERKKLTAGELDHIRETGLESARLLGLCAAVFQKDEFLCTAGSPMPAVMLLTEGVCTSCYQAENGRRLLLGFSRPGDILGDLELLSQEARANTSVQAVSRVRCVYIPFGVNRDTLLEQPGFLRRAARTVTEKFRQNTRSCANNILYDLETRLCGYIAVTRRGALWEEKLTQTAELLGTSYRHLLRTLDGLVAQGILEKRSRGFSVTDLPRLLEKGGGLYDGAY